jgi:hypothetical protein
MRAAFFACLLLVAACDDQASTSDGAVDLAVGDLPAHPDLPAANLPDLAQPDLVSLPVPPVLIDGGDRDGSPLQNDGGGQIICVPANAPCNTGEVCCATGCVSGTVCP